jgi:Tfp pilus assembly protein PilX
MKIKSKQNGSVFLMVVFVIALMAILTTGILQMTTEDILIMRNQVFAAEAMATAEAGLNDAFYELRSDSSWTDGFTGKSFNNGSYTVVVEDSNDPGSDLLITSTGTSAQGFITRVEADITLSSSSPYIICIDNFRINE